MPPRRAGYACLGWFLSLSVLYADQHSAPMRFSSPMSFQGHTLSEWLTDLQSPKREIRKNAVDAFMQIGPTIPTVAIPALLKSAQDPDALVRWATARALAKFPAHPSQVVPALMTLLDDVDVEVAEQAARALGKFTPRPVERLAERLANPSCSQSSTCLALAEQGASAFPLVERLLTHPDSRVRARAVCMVGMLAPHSAPALPTVMKMLESDEPNVRAAAALAIGLMNANGSTVVPVLMKLVADNDSTVRKNAICSLGRFGEGSREAIPLLVITLTDPCKDVVFAAHDALREIGRTGSPELLVELNHPVESVRFAVLRLIESMRAMSVPSDAVLPLLTDPSERVRVMAVKAAAKHHANDKRVVAALHDAERDPCEEVRRTASAWVRFIKN